MTATSPPTIPVQRPESLSPKSRKGTKLAAAVVGGLVLLGGGFAAGYQKDRRGPEHTASVEVLEDQ